MANKTKQKRRLKRAIRRNVNKSQKAQLDEIWRGIFVRAGILKD